MKKFLSIGIMLLFIGMIFTPLIRSYSPFDDTTPPVTTYSLNPLEPNGENGYYISNVNITLNATDDISGVKEIRYRIEKGSWHIIHGDNGTFVVDEEGNDVLIEYYAIDNAGNEEETKSFSLDIDKTPPSPYCVEVAVYKDNETGCYMIEFIIKSDGGCSGMDRVEIFLLGEHHETIEGSGPDYCFVIYWSNSLLGHSCSIILYDRAGHFIEIKIGFRKVFLFGRIENLTKKQALFSFNAVRLLVVQLPSYSHNICTSNEQIQVFRPRWHIITDRFISGFFINVQISIHT